jgi:hypothetical protein
MILHSPLFANSNKRYSYPRALSNENRLGLQAIRCSSSLVDLLEIGELFDILALRTPSIATPGQKPAPSK